MDQNNNYTDPLNVDDASAFEDVFELPTIIKAIGVGGGGGNAVDHMYSQGIKNVSFANINTDYQDLKNSKVPTKIVIGDGLGAGNVPEVAREAAENSADEIAKLFDDDTKMVFITAGMGGGTGTGAAPVVARIAKERGLLTIGIVTIPFLFEGRKKIIKAIDAADEMAKNVDALMVINNERLTEIYGDYTFLNAFAKADDTLTIAARSISELITTNSAKMNLDFKDVNTTLRNGGHTIISTGFGEGEHRVSKAIEDALHSPLLKNRDIMSSKKLLFNLYFSSNADDQFKMTETSELADFISSIDEEVDVIWGVAIDDTLGDQVKITILAAGFEMSLPNDSLVDRAATTPRREFHHNRDERKEQKPHQPSVGATVDEEQKNRRVEQEYGQDKIKDMKGSRQRYIILSPNQFEDEKTIELLWSTPTFNREKRVVEQIRASQNAGRYNDSPDNGPAPGQGTIIKW